MKKREFLYTVVWRCLTCDHEQTRGYDKKPFASDYFEGGRLVHRLMICKGTCRRPPSSKIEHSVTVEGAARDFAIDADVYLGDLDGEVPQTTHHLMVTSTYNPQEKKRREAMR